MMLIQRKPETKRIIAAGILFATIYSIGVFELGREFGQLDSNDLFRRQLSDCGGHSKKIFGHVHVAKTAGTSINGILANKFERVCGHKGYSYDAFADNVKAGQISASGGRVFAEGRSQVMPDTMAEIGFEDCDYVSHEIESNWCK